jgi:signal transduction histidine kinase/ligand-binding sensor domain-containing protein
MKLFLLSIVAFIVLLPGVSGGQVLPFTHYTPENEVNPLPSAEVTRVYQDKLGYMWFAVYSSGIVRYDGVNMEVYGLDEGLSDLYIWDLNEDSAGRLWVSSNAGIVVSEKALDAYGVGEKIRFVRRFGDTELINVAVNHNKLATDEDGQIWVGTESLGIVRYRFSSDSALESDTLSTVLNRDAENVAVRSLVARSDGSVWVALLGGDLLKYENGDVSATYTTGSPINVNTLYESPDGTLWGGEQSGSIWRLNEENDEPEFIFLNSTSTSNIPNITIGSDGLLWVSSEGSGLQKLDPVSGSQIATYTRANGLLAEVIYNLYQDRENNIWIAQSGGISKLRYNYKAFLNLTANSFAGEKPTLPSPSVNAVLSSLSHTTPCKIWAGTSEGGIACIDENFDSEFIQLEVGLTGNWVNGIIYDQSGRVWIGTARGLNSISFTDTQPLEDASSTSIFTVFDTEALLSTYPAASILAVEKMMVQNYSESESEIESIWFPAYQAVYAVINDRLFTLDTSNGLPAAIFHTVAFDSNRYLWVGTRDRGIYRSTEPVTAETLLKNAAGDRSALHFEPWWSAENGAPSNQIEKMLWYSGSMWVGTPAGLAVLESGSTTIKYLITASEGLRASNATSFAVSPVSGMLWVGTNQGLAEIDPETGKVLRTVTRLDGLVDNEVWFYGSVHFDPLGTLYFGTARGISIYNPDTDKTNEVPPTLKLTNFLSENIPGERNEYIFEYAALSFGNERQIRYQTRLIGFNDEWSPFKSDTRVNFTNLSAIFLPKLYTFEVQAINESGIPSVEPISFEFHVAPPALLSWWAFLIYLVILAIGIFGVDRFQRARLIKQEREAAHLRETELKAETAIARSTAAEAQAKALQAENDLKAAELEKARELEIAYHELKSTQNRLIQAEKMASLGRLSTGIAHEIKNPLNFINNFSEVSRELVEELKTALAKNDQEEVIYIMENLSFNTQKIDEHGKRADAIVRSMMQHSRGGQGEFEDFQLNQLIKEYTDLAYHGKKSQNSNLDVLVNMQLDPSVTRVKMIPQKIGQVLQNIVENAIDSMWDHKKKVDGEYRPEIQISSRRSNGYVEIKIADNGPGIPEHIKERIFEPFFTTKPTGEGTGLGLSLSYDFITQIHSGKLELADSELGGAAFVISLPASS